MPRTPPVAAVALLLAACNRDASQTRPTATAAPTPVPTVAAAPPLPPGRTPVPSIAEYAAAHEVTVKGSTALHCETKMIREWLRVVCRGKTDSGGWPTTIVLTRGGRGETVVYAAGSVTSLIMPVLEGTDFEARFSWTDASHPLIVRWPRGGARPPVVGEFLGAASPLDGTAPSAVICDCHKKVTGARDCTEAPMAQPDCERTYAGHCDRLLACARGEPGAPPSCLAGKRNAGVTGWCASLCSGPTHACAIGTECSHEWGEPAVCL